MRVLSPRSGARGCPDGRQIVVPAGRGRTPGIQTGARCGILRLSHAAGEILRLIQRQTSPRTKTPRHPQPEWKNWAGTPGGNRPHVGSSRPGEPLRTPNTIVILATSLRAHASWSSQRLKATQSAGCLRWRCGGISWRCLASSAMRGRGGPMVSPLARSFPSASMNLLDIPFDSETEPCKQACFDGNPEWRWTAERWRRARRRRWAR